MQRIAFLPRTELDDPLVADIFNQPLQNLASQAGARHLASAEEDRGLDLIALVQKTQHVVLLGLVVVIVHVDAELHFFDRDRLLVLLRLALFFLLLVQEFPIIHDAANRRLRCRGNFYQIEVAFAGHLERFERWQDPDLFAFVVNHANFAGANTLICADKSFVDTKPPVTRSTVWECKSITRGMLSGWKHSALSSQHFQFDLGARELLLHQLIHPLQHFILAQRR